MGVRITGSDLWVGSFHARRPLAEFDPSLDHIHGRLEISIDDRLVPALGYFGPDDVCLDTWLFELWTIFGRLSEGPKGSYEFDEGEQGQPCFRFERDGETLFISVVDGAGGGLADPDWQRVEVPLADFGNEVVRFTDSIRRALMNESPRFGSQWIDDHLDPTLADAYERRSLDALTALLSAGVRPDAVDARSTAARIVDLAISDDEHEIVRLLARHGSDIDRPDGRGLSPLHRSARAADQNPMLETLVNCGASISGVDDDGWTALHHAGSCGYLGNAELLLRHGADRAGRTATGLTAADLASANNHVATAKVLAFEGP